MAKNVLGKVLAGIGIIGAGVAVGLTIYNKLEEISRDLEDDEFEDDFEELDDEFDEEDEETTYVTLVSASEETDTDKEPADNAADADDATETKASDEE